MPKLKALGAIVLEKNCMFSLYETHICTVKPVYIDHSQKDQKLVFKTNYRLMQVKSIAECSAFCNTFYLH